MKKYRILRHNEFIRKGDECFLDMLNVWHPTCFGKSKKKTKVGKTLIYRRLMKDSSNHPTTNLFK